MRIICAWCDTIIQPGDNHERQDSHGICGPCFKVLAAKLHEKQQEPRPTIVEKMP